MSVRPCLVSDLPVDGAPWLVADQELAEGSSVVDVHDGHLVAAGLRQRSRSGPQDLVELWCVDGSVARVLRALTEEDRRPALVRVRPHTPVAAAVDEVGGEVVQSVPEAYFDTASKDVQTWAAETLREAEARGATVCSGAVCTLDELLDLWVAPYLRMHQGWAPIDDVAVAREGFCRRFEESLDRELTAVAEVAGTVVAATFVVGPFDGVLMPILIQVDPPAEAPAVPGGSGEAHELAAAATIAAVLSRAEPLPVEFDGHADDAVYLSILERIPGRSAGALTPMDLVRVGGAGRRP